MIMMFSRLKPQPKELLWIAITFVFFFLVSLGVNYFRSRPLSLFGNGIAAVKSDLGNDGKTKKWEYCNLGELDVLKAKAPIFIIDARPGLFYKFGHIPGAISLPAQTKELSSATAKVLAVVPTNQTFVIYCADEQCENAETVAEQILLTGYKNIYILSGGWSVWTEAGRTIEKYRVNFYENHEIRFYQNWPEGYRRRCVHCCWL